jgi:hypothetical protein
MKVSLDNIEEFKVPLVNYISKWLFTDENDRLASEEHQDQIFPLTRRQQIIFGIMRAKYIYFALKNILST